jgi:hypothetical protein
MTALPFLFFAILGFIGPPITRQSIFPTHPTMSCDEQNRFEMVLRSLEALDATINFLPDQSVKEVLHLLFIEEDDITAWKRNEFLSAIECKILCHLRTYVHTCKCNNNNRLPSNWHADLALDRLSSSLNPIGLTPKRSESPASLIVYIRILGLGNARNLPNYHQFNFFPTETFCDLVGCYLAKAVQDGVLTKDKRVDLILKWPTTFIPKFAMKSRSGSSWQFSLIPALEILL